MAAPPSLEEFISSLPKTTADKGTLVRLYNQIGAVNKEDVDFLLLEKNRIHKCLIDAREKDEKQTSDWIDQMQNDTVIVSSFLSLLYNRSACLSESFGVYGKCIL